MTMATPKVERPHSLVADMEYKDPNGEISYCTGAHHGVALGGADRHQDVGLGDGSRKAGLRHHHHGCHRQTGWWREIQGQRPEPYLGQLSQAQHRWLLQLRIQRTQERSWRAVRRHIGPQRQVHLYQQRLRFRGEIQFTAEVTDSGGRMASAGTSMWASNGDDWMFRSESSDRIDLLPEKKRYEPNEKARFQVRMPFREANVLVTVERDGNVLSSFVTKLSGKSAVIEVPVKEEWAPNAYVSALLVRGRSVHRHPQHWSIWRNRVQTGYRQHRCQLAALRPQRDGDA